MAQINNILESKSFERWLVLLITVIGLLLINIISSRYFFRVDLTEDQRFSITEATKDLLSDIDDIVYVEVYLDGDLPVGFKRMRTAILETLEEFQVYSDGNLQFQFVNPDLAMSEKSRNDFLRSVIQKGIQPTDVFLTENGNRIQKRIIPGATISYGTREIGVQLFKGSSTASPEVRLNQSIEGIEYELAEAIHELVALDRSNIGLVRGHDELDSLDFYSFSNALQQKFRTSIVYLDRPIENLDLLILAQPKSRFKEIEKYHLDQFIMLGGKALFMIDKLAVNMDSANIGTISFPYDLNLDDLLFKYGVRINNNLVSDYVSGTYPIVVGNSGEQPQIQLLQWPFYPVVNDYSNHVIVRNIDAIITRFVSSIDTVKAPGILKTRLFSSSQYSRVSTAPVVVDIQATRENLSPDYFKSSHVPLGYLLEGSFNSFYANKFLPDGADDALFKPQGEPSRIIVIADGDIARNDIDPRSGAPLPLGRDPFSRDGFEFANQDMLLNAVNYLIAGDGIISARAKQVMIRPLDQVKVKASRRYWQTLNLVAPIALLIVFGIVLYVIRRKKYSKF